MRRSVLAYDIALVHLRDGVRRPALEYPESRVCYVGFENEVVEKDVIHFAADQVLQILCSHFNDKVYPRHICLHQTSEDVVADDMEVTPRTQAIICVTWTHVLGRVTGRLSGSGAWK